MAKFKTKARAIDMLGRQQIAGVPTAISELFKNAHDAYANRVEVDYFLKDGLFVLGDDGIGMTRQDFESRWLTIGAQTRDETSIDEIIDLESLGLEKRPTMGEKGIGRLAIATIGPQVLVLSRAIRKEGLQDLVCSFVNWKIFECYNIDLDDIEIPVITLPGGSLPDRNQLRELVGTVEANVKRLKDSFSVELYEEILKDLGEFSFDPQEFAGFLKLPKLTGDCCGTQFYIFPTSDTLRSGVEEYSGTGISKLRQLLLGFNNTFVPDAPKPKIKTAFRYWETNDNYEDLINSFEFFTPEEFMKTDHQFVGNFDAYGRFKGDITIYGNTYHDHVVDCRSGRSIRTVCGPFQIKFAYLQGKLSESRMIPDEYYPLKKKLESGLAGLYIYRDGIRILPYGDSEVDFLRMEENRTKSASYYFFSYRRIFGAIEITKSRNSSLVEKAGREGFQENRAYSDFRSILETFFEKVTATFFRPGGSETGHFREWQNYYKRISNAMKIHGEQSDAIRSVFEEDVTGILNLIEEKEPQRIIERILKNLETKTAEIIGENLPEDIQKQLIALEASANLEINAIREEYMIEKPAQLGLEIEQNRLWKFYLGEMEKLDSEYFAVARKQTGEIINKFLKQEKITIEKKQRISILVKEIQDSSHQKIVIEVEQTEESLHNANTNAETLLKAVQDDYSALSEQIQSEVDGQDVSRIDDDTIETFRINLENRLLSKVSQVKETLSNIRATLSQVKWEKDAGGNILGQPDWISAIEDDWLAQRERFLADLEATQLGKTIEIINHEFESTVKSIRTGLTRMKRWADRNADLNEIYTGVRDSFSYLDGYLTMFTPLQRRLYRTPVTISGNQIEQYLRRLFGDKIDELDIVLEVTDAFRENKTETYPSSLYPVFVNIADNAMFWLRDRPDDRKIILDSNAGAFLVSNNGPKILERDRGAIFERGFSKKPGGTGLGLFISREILKREGYGLELVESENNEYTTFKIFKMQQNTEKTAS
ncbi:ATP-binding protein [Chloroflexota bacterium]